MACKPQFSNFPLKEIHKMTIEYDELLKHKNRHEKQKVYWPQMQIQSKKYVIVAAERIHPRTPAIPRASFSLSLQILPLLELQLNQRKWMDEDIVTSEE